MIKEEMVTERVFTWQTKISVTKEEVIQYLGLDDEDDENDVSLSYEDYYNCAFDRFCDEDCEYQLLSVEEY